MEQSETEKERAEVHERLLGLYERVEQLADNHAMLMDGVQIVVHGQTKVDDRIDGLITTQATLGTSVGVLANELRWMRVAIFMMLLWQVGSTVLASKPAQAMFAMVAL